MVERQFAVLLGQLRPPDVAEAQTLDTPGRGDCGKGAARIDLARRSDRLYAGGAVGVTAGVQRPARDRIAANEDRVNGWLGL